MHGNCAVINQANSISVFFCCFFFIFFNRNTQLNTSLCILVLIAQCMCEFSFMTDSVFILVTLFLHRKHKNT